MKLYKSINIPTLEFAQQRIAAYQAWFPECDGPNPLAGCIDLKKYVGQEIEWVDETEKAYNKRIAAEEEQEEEQEKLETDLEYFLDQKVRPKRNGCMYRWVDETFAKPLLYDLTDEQIEERKETRKALLDYPSTITGYIEDSVIDADLAALKPSYIS